MITIFKDDYDEINIVLQSKTILIITYQTIIKKGIFFVFQSFSEIFTKKVWNSVPHFCIINYIYLSTSGASLVNSISEFLKGAFPS